MEYPVITTKKYRKALRRLNKHKGFSLECLEDVIDVLKSGASLPEKNRDHQLSGYLQKYRECHVRPDVLLLYEICDDVLVLVLINVGSHQEIFG